MTRESAPAHARDSLADVLSRMPRARAVRRVLMHRVTVVAFACPLALSACASPDDGPEVTQEEIAVPPDAVQEETAVRPDTVRRPGIRFDPDSIVPGTRVGDLVLDSIRVGRTPSGPSVGSAFFGGELSLTGHTLRHFDADLAPVSVCFEADPASAARMPRWEGDERRPWFCFDDPAVAARLIASPGDSVQATIVIDDFTIHFSFSDAVNSARIVRMVAGNGS